MPEAAVFDALVREFFSGWFRFHPEAALATGVGDYGGLPTPQSDDEHAALGSLLETLIVALQELDHDALDPQRRLDAELLFGLAAVEHRELLERDWRHRDPLRFLPLGEIHRLTLLAPASLREDLLALLVAIPAHLRLAVIQLTPMAELIPPPLVAAAIRAAKAGPAYLRKLARSRWLHTHCHGTGEIEAAAERAATALRQYAAALSSAIAPRAAGRCGCGAAHLSFLLRRRHHLAVQPADCMPLLERLGATVAAGAVQVAAEPAPARASLTAECVRQQALLRAHGPFTLPAAPLHVATGPVRPRRGVGDGDTEASPALALDTGIDYMPDLTRGRGTVFVADADRTETSAATARAAEMTAFRCLALGLGGLHTLTFAGGMTARSLPRLLAGGVSLRRGWPLALAEQMLPGRTAHAVAVALARLELDLHLGRVTLAEARERAGAFGEADCILAGLVRNPGDALATVLGWQLIATARPQPDAHPAAARDFHDRLVAHGPIPASTALAAALGDAHVRALQAGLCDAGGAAA